MQRTSSRRQQMHSCDICRRRKVRCDSVNEKPCSACKKAAVECRFTVGWRRQRRPRRFSTPSSTRVDDESPRRAASDGATTVVLALDEALCGGGSSRDGPSSSPSSAHTAVSPSCSCAQNAGGNAHRGLRAHRDSDVSASVLGVAPESDVALSLNIAENGLLRFFRDGLSSSSWGVFDMPDNVRVTYLGTHISNMTHLIKLDRPRPQYLVYPYPQIRPPLSWGTEDTQQQQHGSGGGGSGSVNGNGNESANGSANGNAYPPAVVRDINSFPEKEIRDDFINAYFERVNPYFPVIDEADFRARYADPDNQPALVLLHSVLLVGAHVSSHEKAVHARHIVKAVLFRRAKCVFDMRHEHDRLHLVQAALLFTWHLQNGDTASSNSFYWLGVACRIAYGIGMHRDLMKDPLDPDRMPIQDRRIWRRIWWTLFQAEIMSALEHGRPSAIRREDFDQGPLCVEDFREVSGIINPRLQLAYCLKQTELCQIALDIVNLSAPGVVLSDTSLEHRTDELNAQLVRWMLSLSTSTSSSTSNKTAAFGEVYLRLHYHTLVIHLYRLIADRPSSSIPTTSLSEAACEDARRVGSSASGDIVSCFETLYEKNMLAQCPFTAVTALTAAAIQIGKDVQHSLGSAHTMLAVNGLCLLDRVCVAAEHLSVFWPNVEGVRKVFRSLFDRFTTALNGIQQGEPPSAESMLDENFGGVDWSDILGLTWQVGHLQETSQTWDASLFGLD